MSDTKIAFNKRVTIEGVRAYVEVDENTRSPVDDKAQANMLRKLIYYTYDDRGTAIRHDDIIVSDGDKLIIENASDADGQIEILDNARLAAFQEITIEGKKGAETLSVGSGVQFLKPEEQAALGDGPIDATKLKKLKINLGDGENKVSIGNGIRAGILQLALGGGKDTTVMGNDLLIGMLQANTGGGNDEFTTGTNFMARLTDVKMGDGNDKFNAGGGFKTIAMALDLGNGDEDKVEANGFEARYFNLKYAGKGHYKLLNSTVFSEEINGNVRTLPFPADGSVTDQMIAELKKSLGV